MEDSLLYHRKKILVCTFGVISRSLKWTYESILKRIITPLKEKYDIELYGFNIKIDSTTPVDETILDNNDIHLLPFDYLEELDQTALDISLEEIKKEVFTRFRGDYSPATRQNALRQMYSEYRVGKFIELHKDTYDLALVIGPDYWFANSLNLDHINDAIINNVLYLSNVNPGQGLTNGFYFGKTSLMIPLLTRFTKVNTYLDQNKDYESIVLKCVKDNSIPYRLTNIVFFKIRANKYIHWQGGGRVFFLNRQEIKDVFTEFMELQTRGFRPYYYAGMNDAYVRKVLENTIT